MIRSPSFTELHSNRDAAMTDLTEEVIDMEHEVGSEGSDLNIAWDKASLLGQSAESASNVLNFYLPEGYRGVQLRIEEGKACNEAIVKMLNQRMKFEETYSLNLRSWAFNWKDKFPEAGAYGSFGKALRKLIEEADWQGTVIHRATVELAVGDESIAGLLSKRTKEQLYHADKLGNLRDSSECKAEFKKSQKFFVEHYHKLEKRIGEYWQASRQLDAARHSYEKLKNEFGSSDKLREAKSKIDGAQKKVDARLDKYRTQYQALDRLLPTYMEAMRMKFDIYQKREQLRLQCLKETMESLIKMMLDCAENHLTALQSVGELIGRFVPEVDLQFWSENYGADMRFDLSAYSEIPPPDKKTVRTAGPQAQAASASTSSRCSRRSSSFTNLTDGIYDRSTNVINDRTTGAGFAIANGGLGPQLHQSNSRVNLPRNTRMGFDDGTDMGSDLMRRRSMCSQAIPPSGTQATRMPQEEMSGRSQMAYAYSQQQKAFQTPSQLKELPTNYSNSRFPQVVASPGPAAFAGPRPQQQLLLPPPLLFPPLDYAQSPDSNTNPKRESESRYALGNESIIEARELKYFVALHRFDPTEEDECPALAGDVLRLHSPIDSAEWLVVANMNAPGEPTGNIPKSFVQELGESEWEEQLKTQMANRDRDNAGGCSM